jgi:hypothetical protein
VRCRWQAQDVMCIVRLFSAIEHFSANKNTPHRSVFEQAPAE